MKYDITYLETDLIRLIQAAINHKSVAEDDKETLYLEGKIDAYADIQDIMTVWKESND